MKPYPRYKKSGTEWIGDIPTNWDRVRLKFLSHIKTGEKDTVDRCDGGIYPFYVRAEKIERINSYSFDGEAVLTAGDGVGVGRVFHYINDKFDYHQRVYKVSNFYKIDGKYFFYYMKENFHKEVMKISAKSTVDSLRLPMLQNFPVSFGSSDEQKQIASYLDHKTTKMDTLIEKKKKLIDLLKEERTAVINETVTKGLDPNVKMKNSGIEWLGEIPAHWDVTFIKRKVKRITDGAHISPETKNGIYPFISIRDINGSEIDFENCLLTSNESYEYLYKNGCKPEKNDILFSKDGTIGKTILINFDKDFVVASSLIIIKIDSGKIDPDYLNFLYNSNIVVEQINAFVKGAALKRISILNISKIIGVFPPIIEQQQIANHLNKETNRIDTIISKSKKQIKLLKEYRTALISEVVTGKIDVRDWKEPEK